MAHRDGGRWNFGHARRGDEVLCDHLQGARACHAGEGRDSRDADGDHGRNRRRTPYRAGDDGQQQGRESQQQIGATHDEGVEDAIAAHARHHTERNADERGNADGDDAPEERDACADHQARGDVATKAIGAEEMLSGAARQQIGRGDVRGIRRPEKGDRREEGGDTDENETQLLHRFSFKRGSITR